jgi:glycosyltransferase involved in cell wall biosynthesis
MPVASIGAGSLVTVAVPTCNGAAHLAEALGSILAQDGVAFELVVSDDRSDDDSMNLVRAIAGDRARIEVNAERLGLAGNWNRCAALANTPHVAIFHQDDVMSAGHLAAHLAALVADERIGLVASAADVIDERGDPVPEAVVERGGLGAADQLIAPGQLAGSFAAGNPFRCSAVTLRVAAFTEVGGFDRSYHYLVDLDLWLRISRRWKVAWLAKPTVKVRWHAASETHRFKGGTGDLDEAARMIEELFTADLNGHPDRARLWRIANARLARAFLNRAHDALRSGRTELAREALRRGLRRSPGMIQSILRDPRLCIQMAALAAAPRLAARLFGRGPFRADPSAPFENDSSR